MVTATTLLKIVGLMLIVSSQTTVCDVIQSQDIVLVWRVFDQKYSNSHIFRFNSTGFSEFYNCLCRFDTVGCTIIARSSNEYKIVTDPRQEHDDNEYEKPYRCYITTYTTELYCGRIRKGESVTPLMCMSYKDSSQMPTICKEDTVEIMSAYVTTVNEDIDDSLVQVNDCLKNSTSNTTTKTPTTTKTTTTTTAASFLSESSTPMSTFMQTLSNNTQTTSIVFTSSQKHSTSKNVITSTTKPFSTLLTSSTVTTSKTSKLPVPSTSAKATSLAEEEDNNDNLVTIILGVALGVVVIIATVIIILVVFWRRQKGNSTSASSRKNHGTRTDDYETPYEMSDVSTSPAENSNSQASVSVPGPNSYATVDLEKKHRNRKGKNSKKNSKGDHVYNNENVLKTLGKKGHGKSSNVTSHVADYYNLDPQRNEPTPLNSAVYANKDITSVKSNDDEHSIVNKTSTSAFANATNNSNDSSSSKKNANSTENSTDDEKNRLGHVDQPNRVIEHKGGECQDAGPEYSRLHETQRHFQNPYNILPDQVPVSKKPSTTQTTTDDPNSSSFNITTDTTSAYSLATPISK